MNKFITLTALAAVIDRPNVDTDLLVPKQFLTRIERSGFGQFLFNNIRYKEDGSLNPEFPLNFPRYKGAEILVSRVNFGSGSSREHAPWALLDYGFKCIICPKFADIFKSNSLKNGLLLVELTETEVDTLIKIIEKNEAYTLTVDLLKQEVKGSEGFQAKFEIDPFRKEMLINGWDDISLTLEKVNLISAYEEKNNKPWQAGVNLS